MIWSDSRGICTKRLLTSNRANDKLKHIKLSHNNCLAEMIFSWEDWIYRMDNIPKLEINKPQKILNYDQHIRQHH
jgi:hypothetical protein